MTYIIKPLSKTLAINAHAGTSFVPEKRGQSHCDDFMTDCEAFIAKFTNIPEHKQEQLDIMVQRYLDKYHQLYTCWLHAKTNCISTMITGGSKFPVARAMKANDRADNHLRTLIQWKEKAETRIFNYLNDAGGIRSDDADALDKLRDKIKSLEEYQERMKAVNIAFRKFDKNGTMTAFCESVKATEAEVKAYYYGVKTTGKPCPTWELSNNNANLKRYKERLEELEKKRSQETKEHTIEGLQVVENVEADRLQIFFPDKPSSNMISVLKHNGYRWSPSNGCWQAYLTNNSKYKFTHFIITEYKKELVK